MARTKLNPELEKALAGMDMAYSSASKSWFDYLSDDVVVYSNLSVEPYNGKEAYEQHFMDSLLRSKRSLSILSRDVQDMGTVAVVYQTVQVQQENVVVSMKQSQVWQETSAGWKMNHLHSAIIGRPQAIHPDLSGTPSISLINERTTTRAASLGLAQ